MQMQGNLNSSEQNPKTNTSNARELPSFERLDSFGQNPSNQKQASPFNNIELTSSVKSNIPFANPNQGIQNQVNNQGTGAQMQNSKMITPFNTVAYEAFKNNGSTINQNPGMTASKVHSQNETSVVKPVSNNQSLSSSAQRYYYLDGGMSHNASQEAIFPRARFNNSAVAKLTANIPVTNSSTSNANRAQSADPRGAESMNNSKIEQNRIMNASYNPSNVFTSLNTQNLGNSQYNETNQSQKNSAVFQPNTSTNPHQLGNSQQGVNQLATSVHQQNMSQSKIEASPSTGNQVLMGSTVNQANIGPNLHQTNGSAVNQPSPGFGVQANSTQEQGLPASLMPYNFSGLSSASAVSILLGNALNSKQIQSTDSSRIQSNNQEPVYNNAFEEKMSFGPEQKEPELIIKPKNMADALELQALASQQSTKKTLYHLFDNKSWESYNASPIEDEDTPFKRSKEKEFSKLTSPPMFAYQDHLQKSILKLTESSDKRTSDGFGMFNIATNQFKESNSKGSNDRELSNIMTESKIQPNMRTSTKEGAYDFQAPIRFSADHNENITYDARETHQSGDSRLYSAALLDFFKQGNLLNDAVETPARNQTTSQVKLSTTDFFTKGNLVNDSLGTPFGNRTNSQTKQPSGNTVDLGSYFNKVGELLTPDMLQDGEDSDKFFYRTPIKRIFPPNLTVEKHRGYKASTLADGDENESGSALDRSSKMTRSIKKSAPKNEVKVEKTSPEKYRYFEKDIQLDDYDFQIQRLKEHGKLVINESATFGRASGLKGSRK